MTNAITIYGIKNCDTMKKARAWLDGHGVAYDFHDYKTAGIDEDKLKGWATKVGWETLLNRAGTTFRKLPDGDKEGLNERKAIALMLEQPSMIKRPVLDLGGKLLVGFKPEIYAKEVKSRRPKGLAQLNHVVGRTPAWCVRHQVEIDYGVDHADRHRLRPHAHQVVDLETAFEADCLVGADDLFNGIAAPERQQQPLIGNILAVGVQHGGYRISRPFPRRRAIRRNDARVAVGPDRVVEITVGPLSGSTWSLP